METSKATNTEINIMREKSKKLRTKKKRNKVLIHVFIIAVGTIMLYPLLWMVSSSFKEPTEIFTSVSFFPTELTFENYIQGWAGLSGVTFGKFFINTFLIVTLAIIGNVISCSMAAFAFSRLNFSFKRVLFALMLVTLMLPFHVTIIPQYIIFNQLDWVNTYLPLTLPKFFAVEGFFIFLMVQFMRGIPRDLEQAAEIDGCGPFRIYWNIIIPLSLPALVTTMIFTFIWTWNDFFSQLLYLSNINLYTVALGLRMFLDSAGQSAWGPMFAMSTLSLIPLFIVFIFFQRYLIEGITAGGVKG
ncbi:carbohydrate ABC transporter permease [Evansella cellulosilytica]|uniref:Binding-protein-dependent transport systems inner membrane component n=1 Tax=Evansella cellulosilytica (strain ATCC 21833 / DSM 2522 / FERM P-1141 / JCM 9156 / N-4) TaxID=649639 RepID=E6TTH7_EVAC2|nr:carbohydrate ABC transporter permease [Evansella cellulosilytica]ADU29613.1 binding-protein-dependent transport systems inner membrane component [Evansella cellulosilytica DSM 2522]